MTRWLPAFSILVVVERIYRYHLKLNYKKKKNITFLQHFLKIFRIKIKLSMFKEKK